MRLRRAVVCWAAGAAVLLGGASAAAQDLGFEGSLAPSTEALGEPSAEPSDLTPPPLVEAVARWAVRAGDNEDLPYIVVDKLTAGVFVFDAAGAPIAATPALLGSAFGDTSSPGVGDRELSDIAPHERTTPAGRFKARFGPAAGGTRTFWVDFGTAISLHPVVTTNRKERRLQRLASPSTEDNRITFGCINVPKAFYNEVIKRHFGGAGGVVYILPDSRPVEDVLPSFWHAQRMAEIGSTQAAP